MKGFILLACTFAFFNPSNGQDADLAVKGPIFYANSFSTYNASNSDSALYFVRLLAADSTFPDLLPDVLHNSFAQAFIKTPSNASMTKVEKETNKKRIETAHQILAALALDTDANLASAVKPLEFWVKIQQNENNLAALRRLTTGFIQSELSKADGHKNRTVRYAFLIHQVLARKKALKALAAALFDLTTEKIKGSQVTAGIDAASRDTMVKRAWGRYLYAYANYIKAKESVSNRAKAGYLKTAYDYSPDESDRNHTWAYAYDAYFLFNEEKLSFQEDYFNFLLKGVKDRETALATILNMALQNRDYKEPLKNFYKANFPTGQSFSSFWVESMNKNLKPAVAISLKGLDGKEFSISGNSGKWTLIDFWGTWCGPCRKEHPDLEKFYRDVVSRDTGRLALLTIACNDDEERVASYMAQYKYNFPVAMSDGKIQKAYGVSGYPFKVLVTPQGRYVVIPFGTDWVNFIKGYADL